MTQKNHVLIDGLVGPIEVLIDHPPGEAALRGIALVAHPHPIGGGAATNKVAHTLARTFAGLGYVAFRPNFRSVGQTAGEHDAGIGETDDLLHVLDYAREHCVAPDLPIVLAGFSFGAFVQTRVARRLAEAGTPVQRLVLVGTASGFVEGTRHYDTEAVPHDTLVIHGAADETVPLANVLAWAEPQELPVVVVPAADHFFHRRLHLLRDIITRNWQGVDQ